MDFQPSIIKFAAVSAAIILVAIIVWHVRRQERLRGPYDHAYKSSIDAAQRQALYTAGNVALRTVYWLVFPGDRQCNQQFIVLKIKGQYFQVAVLKRRYWNGYGEPPIAFKGWTSRLKPDELLEEGDLAPNRHMAFCRDQAARKESGQHLLHPGPDRLLDIRYN